MNKQTNKFFFLKSFNSKDDSMNINEISRIFINDDSSIR